MANTQSDVERLQQLLKEKDMSIQREIDNRFAVEQRYRQQEAQVMQMTAQLQQAQQQTLVRVALLYASIVQSLHASCFAVDQEAIERPAEATRISDAWKTE